MLFIEIGGVCGSRDDPCNESDVKWLCIFYNLPYIEEIAIKHIIDFMHTEKNITYAIIETLLGSLDMISSR